MISMETKGVAFRVDPGYQGPDGMEKAALESFARYLLKIDLFLLVR